MSHCGALPVDTEQSDSRILIEAVLARVREDAQLDAEPVLPPLDVLLGRPPTPEPAVRLVVGPSARELPSARSIVKASVRESGRPTGVTTAKIARPAGSSRRAWWPVFLCGFIAGVFGGVAFMKSPVGQRPAVQRMVKQAEKRLGEGYAATVAAKTRLVNR